MKPLTRRPALIFDMDGVLWSSDEIHAAAYQSVLGPLGVTVPPYATLAGRRTDEVIRSLLSQSGVKADAQEISRLTAEKQMAARRKLQAAPPLAPRCREVLEVLHQRFRLALASSASAGSVDVFLQASQTARLFEHVVTGADVTAAKPAPDVYLETIRKLGLDASQAYAIEDSASGVESAAGAGLDVIGFCTVELAGHKSGRVVDVITSLTELLSL